MTTCDVSSASSTSPGGEWSLSAIWFAIVAVGRKIASSWPSSSATRALQLGDASDPRAAARRRPRLRRSRRACRASAGWRCRSGGRSRPAHSAGLPAAAPARRRRVHASDAELIVVGDACTRSTRRDRARLGQPPGDQHARAPRRGRPTDCELPDSMDLDSSSDARRSRRARLSRPPGVGVGRARRRRLRGDDERPGAAPRRARRRGAVLDARRSSRRRRRATAR